MCNTWFMLFNKFLNFKTFQFPILNAQFKGTKTISCQTNVQSSKTLVCLMSVTYDFITLSEMQKKHTLYPLHYKRLQFLSFFVAVFDFQEIDVLCAALHNCIIVQCWYNTIIETDVKNYQICQLSWLTILSQYTFTRSIYYQHIFV